MEYKDISLIYDEFMDNVPYGEWCDFVTSQLKEEGIVSGIVCDMGCGTGNLTFLLRDKGYDMIGIDVSAEMLGRAAEKNDDGSVLFLNQDLREMELYGTVKAFVCTCDTVNHITDEDELLQVFRLVNNYLDPGGIFIFDFCTPDYYREIGDSVIAESRDDAAFIWENYYSPGDSLDTISLSIFTKGPEDLYRRSDELYRERAYGPEEIKKLLRESGMEFLRAYDDYSFAELKGTGKRVVFVAKEKGK